MTRPVIAVDLGDTTVAAAADVSAPGGGNATTASSEPVDLTPELAAVFAPGDGDALITGTEARRRAAADPSRFEPTPRRRADDGELLLGTRTVGVAEAWGAVVSDTVARAGPLLRGGRPRTLVLTHPVGWDSGRIELLRRAGSGLADELLLLFEPMAAATYAAWMRPRRAGPGRGSTPVAVLDVGATGAAASVVVPARGRVLAHRTDGRFGGADVDEMLLDHLLADPASGGRARDRFREVAAGATIGDRRHRQVLMDDIRAAKERLSDVEQAEVPLPGGGTAAWLARSEVEEVLGRSWHGVVGLLADVVAAAGTTPERLDSVWLTGGAARTPQLATLIHRELGVPATVAPDPGLVVARGALVAARQIEDAARSAPTAFAAPGPAPAPPPDRTPPSSPAASWNPPPAPVWNRPSGPAGSPPPAPAGWSPPPVPPEPRAPRAASRLAGDDPRAPEPYDPMDPFGPDDPLGWDDEPLDDDDEGYGVAADPRGHPSHPSRHPDPDPGPVFGPPDPEADTVRVPPDLAGGHPRGRSRPTWGGPRPGEPDPFRASPGRRGAGHRRGRLIAVVALVAAVVVGATAVVLVRKHEAAETTEIIAYAHRLVVPVGWVRAGSDDAARRTLLRPTDAPRGPDLVAVQDNPVDGTDPAQVREQLRAQFDAARGAGSPVTDLQLDTTFGGRDVARYRQDPAPGMQVDWIVVLTPGSQVSVGCRHGIDGGGDGGADQDAARVREACEQVVAGVGPLDP